MATHYMMQLAKIIHTKKILEKGESLQKMREEVAEDTAVPLQATGTEGAPEGASRPQQQPKLYSRFAQEEAPKDSRTLLKMNVLKQLTSELNLKKLDTETGSDPKKMALLREKTKQAALTIMERDKIHIGDRNTTDLFIKEILDEALGLGPLEVLLADPTITEIMVNRKDQIYVEKNGKIVLSPMSFTSNSQLLGIIERIVAPLGRRIDEKTPYCDARLLDGSRVHAIIPPLAIQGPMITIRKFSRTPYTVTDLTKFGSITDEMADFLRAAIEARQNCVVSGGTGTGKTTLLNVLSSFIPSSERIITIEDSAELQLSQPHWGRLESRPPNIEGTGAITIRDLVRNTLRMRPDRIVVGECRDGAALDMLQAMNTGHDGSLTTIHSNSPRDCLSRLETLVMMAGMDLPSRAIREQIAAAIHLIVQISRFSDGSRKVVQVSEVTGMEKDVITMQDIVVFKQKGLDPKGKVIGEYVFTGNIPSFIHELEKKGLRIPKGFFMKRRTDKTEGSPTEGED
ncbi:MAG: CpaF family protein [Deltaproteobacteria bacterium]|nr:CpaF family protein [Deltaproteobacteria bacterium]